MVAYAEPVVSTEEGWDSLHEELLRLREWVAAEALALRDPARSADSGALSFRYLQCEIARLDRRLAQLELGPASESTEGLLDRKPSSVPLRRAIDQRPIPGWLERKVA
jgi:hypothetical protein